MELEDAIAFVAKKHKGQRDKSGKPYIFHLLRVMMQMKTKDEQLVAILHDVLEDTDATVADLKRLGLNKKLISAVQAITQKEDEDYLKYINRLKKNRLAKAVKFADIADNRNPERFRTFSPGLKRRLTRKYKGGLRKLQLK